MSWKKKEKPLTAKEAIELAKKELAPFWFGSSPLFAAIKGATGIAVHPLEPSFKEQNWLLLFCNPLCREGEVAQNLLIEWSERYRPLEIRFLVIYQTPYSFLRDPKAVATYIKRHPAPCPVVIDSDHALSRAFRAEGCTKCILMEKGAIAIEAMNEATFDTFEKDLQNFLRKTDPGLPLSVPFIGSPAKNSHRIEFGADARSDRAIFPAPGFRPIPEQSYKAAQFSIAPADAAFSITGNWVQDAERIATSDPMATIHCKSPSANMFLVAQSLRSKESPVRTRLTVQLNDAPVAEDFAPEGLQQDEEGNAWIKVDEGECYAILRDLPPGDRNVTLRFPNADRAPVALYGIRFND